MEQQIAIFHGDEEAAHLDVCVEIAQEDTYFDHTDDYGTLEQVKEQAIADQMNLEDLLADLTVCPKGTVTLHVNL